MPSYVFKLTSGAELKADKNYTEGRITELRVLKARTAFNNKRLKFVLSSRYGFSNSFTLMEYAIENKLISGTGRGYTIPGYDKKVPAKKFEKLMANDEELNEAFMTLISEHMSRKVEIRHEDLLESSEDELEDEFED